MNAETSWWVGLERQGFTVFAARYLGAVVPVDEVSAAEANLLQARMDFTATLAAIHDGKQTGEIRRAVLVSRN